MIDQSMTVCHRIFSLQRLSMKHGLHSLYAALLFGALCTSPVFSQESLTGTLLAVPITLPGVLGGHEFVPSSEVKDPFIRTFLRTGLGFGMTPELVVPLVTINDTAISGLKGSLLYALLDVEYQQMIRDWLAFRGRVQVVGRMADETPALISQGVTLFSAFDLGWLFRVHRSDRFLLSGSLGLRNSSVTDVYLQRFIDGIIEYGAIKPQNKLVQTTPTLRGEAGVHGAYAISDLTGLTFGAVVNYGESGDRYSPDEWTYSFTAAVDFNLLQPNGTPVGFVIGARTRSNPLGQLAGQGTSQTFFGRIGYTGSRDFSLGLDLGYELTPIRGLDKRQGFLSGLIDTRLYF
jgi:hypothetical protein